MSGANPDDTPAVGSPASHWGTRDPAAQPPRELVLGLGRMVVETRDRLGKDATPEAIAADLKARGVDVTPDDVARCCDNPY